MGKYLLTSGIIGSLCIDALLQNSSLQETFDIRLCQER